MNHTIVKTPGGEELVLLARADFDAMQEALEDARDAAAAARAIAEIAAGRQEMLTAAEVDAALAAPTLLAFWRGKRGLTQKKLAELVGVAQPFIADLEGGRCKGDPALFLRLARALDLRMEDLIDADNQSEKQ